MSGNDTTNFDNDTSGNHGVPFDTSPDLSGDQGRVRRPHPEDTMQDSTRSRGFQPQGHGADATQKDIPDETQQEFHSPSDGETQRDYSADRTDQDIRTQKTADHSGQITDQDIGAGQQKVWADPFAQENTSDEGGLGFKRQNPAFDKTAKSGGADLASTSGDTNWDALDKPRAGSSASPSQSASTTPQSNPKKSPVGQTFANKYEIVGQIGQGGMGIVYKANDMILGRTVAIKVIKAESHAKAEDISRFRHEAMSIAKLDHPNIIRVHEMSVTAGGDPYFVLEYVDGNSLSNEIRGRKGLPLREAIAITEQICDALKHAHDAGVVHRDLKPSNIMLVKVRDRVIVKLLDFGIAKQFAVDEATLKLLQLTRPGQIFGSPHYMSPEQCHGQADRPASDIYSLGCMFFEMLTGHPPFSGGSIMDTMMLHQTGEIPSVGESVDAELRDHIDDIIATMMAKTPDERYASVSDIKDELLELRRMMEPPPMQKTVTPIQIDINGKLDGEQRGRGKKQAVLVAAIAGFVIVGVGAVIYTGVMGGAKTKSGVSDSTPWKAYDLKGQQLFDRGAYKPALLNFQKAYERAKSEKDGPSKAAKLNTSLTDQKAVYFVLKDADGLDLITQQISENPAPAINAKELDVDSIKKAIAKLDAADIETTWPALAEGLSKLGLSHGSRSIFIDAVDALSKRLKLIPDQRLRSEQMEILRCYTKFDGNLPRISSEQANVLRSILNVQSESLAPAMSLIFVRELQALESVDPESILRVANSAISRGDEDVKRLASIEKSELLFRLNRNEEALTLMLEILQSMEASQPRRNEDVARMLLLVGAKRADLNQSEIALPLLVRSHAMLKVNEGVGWMLTGNNLLNQVEQELAETYANLQRFEQARTLQQAVTQRILEKSGAGSFEYACALYRFSRIYAQEGQLAKASDLLNKSAVIMRSMRDRPPAAELYLRKISTLLEQIKSELPRN
ncbi:serine/threonine protein kinase [Candidatus Obscuribacterales bacterium]|nr:serine/threonine protein kinase [Candidatus Obscuribacterales bacterium]